MFSRGGRRAPGLAPPSPFPEGAGLGETYRAQSLSLSSRLWIYLPTGSANNLWLRRSIFTKLCLGPGQRSARRPLTLAKLPHQAFISSKANISISAWVTSPLPATSPAGESFLAPQRAEQS